MIFEPIKADPKVFDALPRGTVFRSVSSPFTVYMKVDEDTAVTLTGMTSGRLEGFDKNESVASMHVKLVETETL